MHGRKNIKYLLYIYDYSKFINIDIANYQVKFTCSKTVKSTISKEAL